MGGQDGNHRLCYRAGKGEVRKSGPRFGGVSSVLLTKSCTLSLENRDPALRDARG